MRRQQTTSCQHQFKHRPPARPHSARKCHGEGDSDSKSACRFEPPRNRYASPDVALSGPGTGPTPCPSPCACVAGRPRLVCFRWKMKMNAWAAFACCCLFPDVVNLGAFSLPVGRSSRNSADLKFSRSLRNERAAYHIIGNGTEFNFTFAEYLVNHSRASYCTPTQLVNWTCP
jgi:hypothetical protein